MMWPFAKLQQLSIAEPLRWGGAALACFLLFLVLTFPYGPLQARLVHELRRTSGWELRAADWSIGLPAAIEWHEVALVGPANDTIPIAVVRAAIGVLPALTGRLMLDYFVQFPGASSAGMGQATGSVTAASWSLHGPVSVKGHLQQMDLASILKHSISRGTIQGDFSHRWDGSQGANAALKGEGTLTADIKDLVTERMIVGTASIPSLTFARMQASLACRDATCNITEFKGDGTDGSVMIQGHVILRQPLPQSLLDLTVTVIPGAGFVQKAAGLSLPPFQPGTPLTFKLAGPIMNPRIAL